MDKEANDQPFLPMGSLVRATLEFQHVESGESIVSAPRPVLVLQDRQDGSVQIATITSRIEKNHVAKYGHVLEDYQEYGLHKKSAVLCTNSNRGYIAREKLSEPFGKIPFPEMKKILEKSEMLNKREINLQYKLVSDYQHER
ncbi:MAG: hypothetical protein ACQEWW_26390 [Bacillota bacterium]